MMRYGRWLLCALLLLPAPVAFAEDAALPVAPLLIRTAHGDVRFEVEVASTPEQKEKGFMFRKSIPDRHGMIFDNGLPPSPVSMWMKNTLVPLDILFVDEHGVIMNIAQNARPESLDLINSDGPARAEIELAGGSTQRYRIAKGDKVVYSLFP